MVNILKYLAAAFLMVVIHSSCSKPILTPKHRRTVMEITNQGGQTYTNLSLGWDLGFGLKLIPNK